MLSVYCYTFLRAFLPETKTYVCTINRKDIFNIDIYDFLAWINLENTAPGFQRNTTEEGDNIARRRTKQTKENRCTVDSGGLRKPTQTVHHKQNGLLQWLVTMHSMQIRAADNTSQLTVHRLHYLHTGNMTTKKWSVFGMPVYLIIMITIIINRQRHTQTPNANWTDSNLIELNIIYNL